MFPQQEKSGLSLQINKAGDSIPSTIAEGSSGSSDKDYKRFIEISLVSSFESETQLLIAKEVKYSNESLIDITLELPAEKKKLFTAFSFSLKPFGRKAINPYFCTPKSNFGTSTTSV